MAKVVIIGPAHPLRGGLASYDERLAQEFSTLGHEVMIYTFSLQYPGFLFPGKTQMSDEPAPEGIEIRVKINSVNPLNWKKVGRELKRMAPDLIIFRFWLPFMGPCLGTIARTAKKNGKTRCIAITDNVIPHEKRPGDKAFTKYFLRSMDGFVTMSKAVLKDLDVFDTAKPRKFTPHPLYDNFGESVPRETALKQLGLDPAFRYLLFFGFIRGYKGLDIMLDAMSDPQLNDLPVKLIIAGEYYMDAKPIVEQIERLKLADRLIQHNDFIPNSKVGLYFGAADLVVQPYKTATQSGVTQIAYHFNVPMIVTNVSGLPENVPHGKVGYVVEVSSHAVAEGIRKFFKENMAPAFIKGMEEEKKKYSWAVMVQALMEVGEVR